MKAVVKTQRCKGAVEVIGWNDPKIGAEEVLVQVKAASVCGSDLHAYEFLPGYQTPEETTIPVVLGHEWSGVVVETGEAVSSYKVGDHVMGESIQYCGQCQLCLEGRRNICERFTLIGRHIDGAMAEYFRADPRYLHRIPSPLSFEEASTAQPLAVSLHAVVDNCKVRPGDLVVVFGPGIIGLSAAQIARLLGAGKVVVVGLDRDEGMRLPTARELGFATVNGERFDIRDKLRELAGGKRADVVIECSGDHHAIFDGLTIIARGGRMTIIGISAEPVSIFFTPVIRNEIQIHTTFNGTWSNYEQALHLMAQGLLNVKPLLSPRPLSEAVRVFDAALDCELIKPVLIP